MPRRRFLKGLASVAVLAAVGKGVDLLLPMTICRPGEWNGPVTDHFDGTYFYNPEHSNRHKTHKASSLFGWLFRKRVKGEYPIVKENAHRPQLAPMVDGADWEVTMVNHSTMLVRIGGLNILTDPVWSDCTSPVQWAGPKRTRPVGMAWEELPRIDVCLISHDHYDHFDAATLKKLYERDNPLFIVPPRSQKSVTVPHGCHPALRRKRLVGHRATQPAREHHPYPCPALEPPLPLLSRGQPFPLVWLLHAGERRPLCLLCGRYRRRRILRHHPPTLGRSFSGPTPHRSLPPGLDSHPPHQPGGCSASIPPTTSPTSHRLPFRHLATCR